MDMQFVNSGNSILEVKAVTLITPDNTYCLDAGELGLTLAGSAAATTTTLSVSASQPFSLNGKMTVPLQITSNLITATTCYGKTITHNNPTAAPAAPAPDITKGEGLIENGVDVGIRLHFENPNIQQKFAELYQIKVK